MSPEICVLWVASDVLMCSASIWHMCTMSMDRYFTLKYPMRYGRNKTRRMVAGKILFVWVVSVAISSPVCIHGFIDTTSVFNNGNCVPTVANFVIYGSIFAFYIPLLIMIVTYVLTIRILWKNQQRMKYIDRSDLKPRLAQLTAQYTGFAIPKLLTSLRKPTKLTTSKASISRANCERQLLAPSSSGALNNRTNGNINAVVTEADLSEGDEGGGRKNHVVVTYLTLPSPQMYASRSPSPASNHHFPAYSDTDESESEQNYYSLMQTNHSSRSLCTPMSLTTSEKSLHRRLQKRQLYQHQQQELQLLQQDPPQQRQSHCSSEEKLPMGSKLHKEETTYSSSEIIDLSTPELISLSPPLSPLFDDDPQESPQQQVVSNNSADSSSRSSKSSNKSSTDATRCPKQLKKKRYSKRCKKRRNSLTQHGVKTDHLKVPGQMFFRQGMSNKQSNKHAVLAAAVSDTYVSHAGRGVTSDDEHCPDVVSFHLSHGNLNKDYKSVEWDKRYFQIQEEMDRCLEGEFGRCEHRQPRHEQILSDKMFTNRITNTDREPDEKALLKPEVSLPTYLLDLRNADSKTSTPNTYSHSAPNSPLNRRTPDFSKLTSSSDDEREEDVDAENNSDKNDEEGNSTGSSNNSDVITIRLHPPTPKVKGYCDKSQRINSLTNSVNLSNVSLRDQSEQNMLSVKVSNCNARSINNLGTTEHLNGFPHFSRDSFSSNINNIENMTNGVSVTSLSPAVSPIPELVISSEGEMTLEETDDTLDDSPKNQRIKLRRPCQLPSHKSKSGKKQSPHGYDFQLDKPFRSKPAHLRSTFRIHRGKGAVKHILSKKTASNEKKASKVLGIIFLVFVVLWTPFFAMNILNASCNTCMSGVSEEVMSLFLWMGYIASLANPIIYTMFNTAFRRTFIRILTCQIQRTCGTKSSDTHLMSYTTMLASERRNTMTVVLRDESR